MTTDAFAKFAKIMEANDPLIADLNKMAREVFQSGDILDYFTPVKYNFNNSFQYLQLDQPTSLRDARMKVTPPIYADDISIMCKKKGDTWLARHSISVDDLNSLLNDNTKFTVFMSAIYQELLNNLMLRVNDIREYDVGFFLPGRLERDMFLIDPNDITRIEVRLWAVMK